MGFPLLFPGHNISYWKYFKETPKSIVSYDLQKTHELPEVNENYNCD